MKNKQKSFKKVVRWNWDNPFVLLFSIFGVGCISFFLIISSLYTFGVPSDDIESVRMFFYFGIILIILSLILAKIFAKVHWEEIK